MHGRRQRASCGGGRVIAARLITYDPAVFATSLGAEYSLAAERIGRTHRVAPPPGGPPTQPAAAVARRRAPPRSVAGGVSAEADALEVAAQRSESFVRGCRRAARGGSRRRRARSRWQSTCPTRRASARAALGTRGRRGARARSPGAVSSPCRGSASASAAASAQTPRRRRSVARVVALPIGRRCHRRSLLRAEHVDECGPAPCRQRVRARRSLSHAMAVRRVTRRARVGSTSTRSGRCRHARRLWAGRQRVARAALNSPSPASPPPPPAAPPPRRARRGERRRRRHPPPAAGGAAVAGAVEVGAAEARRRRRRGARARHGAHRDEVVVGRVEVVVGVAAKGLWSCR